MPNVTIDARFARYDALEHTRGLTMALTDPRSNLETADPGTVSLLLVSHSAALVQGLADLVGQVAGPSVAIYAIGGAVDGSLGTDGGRVLDALQAAAREPGAVVLMDLGSSVLAVNAALEDLSDEQRARLAVVDAPLVEGAVAAGVLASTGATLTEVAQAAEEARDARKL